MTSIMNLVIVNASCVTVMLNPTASMRGLDLDPDRPTRSIIINSLDLRRLLELEPYSYSYSLDLFNH